MQRDDLETFLGLATCVCLTNASMLSESKYFGRFLGEIFGQEIQNLIDLYM